MTKPNVGEWWYVLARDRNSDDNWSYHCVEIVCYQGGDEYVVYSIDTGKKHLLIYNRSWYKWQPNFFMKLLGYR